MRHITQKELQENIMAYESKLRSDGMLSEDDNFIDVWLAKAKKALDDVINCSDEEKPDRVNVHSNVWTDMKEILLNVSDQKCWYCESKQVRSDNNVDHFRPKNRVIECPDHPGYWWLAFDLTNYRLSCTFCNSNRKDKENKTSGGKHDHFPLLDETKRAYSNPLNDETPMLLDPMIKTDAALIWFLSDGTAIPKWNEAPKTVQYQRADCSIKLYHLNHTNLVELRRELCNYIGRLVEDGNVHFAKYINGDQSAWYSYNRVFEELALTIDKSAEYSKTAKVTLIEYSKKYNWIECIIAD
jgi:uncharacterized protein (TIGR02646 family)